MGSLKSSAAIALVLGVLSSDIVLAADVAAPEAVESSWYISVFGGASFPEDIDYDLIQLGVQTYDGHQELDTGFIIGGAIGARIWENTRAEVELSYQRNDAGDALYDNPGNYPYDGSGHSDAIYVLANAWYDIPVSESFKPYVGGGAGIAFVNQDIDQPDDTFGPNGSDEGFAFQLGAGVGIPLGSSLSFDIGYRFRGILNIDIDGQQAGDEHVDQDIFSHNILAGINLSF